MYSSKTIEVFLQLVRIGIGNDTTRRAVIPDNTDWMQLKASADAQGLTALVLDGLDAINGEGLKVNGSSLPLQMKLEWIGEVLQNYEQRYKAYEKAIGSLAGWYNKHGFRMMVLKGYACSLDWPRPEHRPCGDIDIWQFGRQKESDAILEKEKNKEIDKAHHQHTVFNWCGFTVENHYDFLNIYSHKTNKELERIFKELANDDSNHIEIDGERIYIPSSNLHALFLMRHMVAHFVSVSITLRQALDWACFVKKHTDEIDWEWYMRLIEKFNMYTFFNAINAICVDNLGFDKELFPIVHINSEIKDRVLKDILLPEYTEVEPRTFFKRIVYKYRRWQSNAWKREMCFTDSCCSSFIYGLWSHLIKPSSI